MRRKGDSYAHPLLVLIVLRNDIAITRIGVAAGKSVGGAVERNRAKRVLRAAAAGILPRLQPGWDILLLARRPLIQVKTPAAESALRGLLRRAGLLAGNALTS